MVTVASCYPGHRQRLHADREQEAGPRPGGGHGLLPADPGPASRPPSCPGPATRPPGAPEAAAGGHEASGQHRPGHAAPGAATQRDSKVPSWPLCPGPEQAAAGVGPAAAGEPAGGGRHPGPGPGRGEVRRGNVASAPNYLLQVHSRAHLGHGAVPHLLQRPDLPHGEAALPSARCPVSPPCTDCNNDHVHSEHPRHSFWRAPAPARYGFKYDFYYVMNIQYSRAH